MLQDTTEITAPQQSTQEAIHGAKAILTQWADAVSRQSLEDVLALYAEDAVLVPTAQNALAVTAADRRKYFEGFLSKQGLICRLDSVETRVLGGDTAVTLAGHYTFTFVEDDALQTVAARFLYTVARSGNRWQIQAHHSSKFV